MRICGLFILIPILLQFSFSISRMLASNLGRFQVYTRDNSRWNKCSILNLNTRAAYSLYTYSFHFISLVIIMTIYLLSIEIIKTYLLSIETI